MKPEEVFKRYDVRGKYPEELDEEFYELMGKSLGSFVLEKFEDRVVVCRDNKDSSKNLKDSLVEGILSTGVTVIDAGVGPTDFAAFHGSRNDCVSVQVTSSHMPLNFNGLKFMYPEGNGFVNEDLNALKNIFRGRDFSEGEGEIRETEGAEEEYLKEMKEFIQEYVQETDRKVVVDTLGGASTGFLPEILEELGLDVINIAEGSDGPYYDPPNTKPEILEDMVEIVEKEDAFIGLATDMDADRVAAYYEGEWISGDDLFCIFSQIVKGDAVASIDTSEVLEEFADEVYYTRVGDPFVIDETLQRGADLAGEPNGHYCFPEFVLYNSGTLAAALLAVTDLDPLLENIPEVYTDNADLEVENKAEVMERVVEEVKKSYKILSDRDGVKFSTGDASVLIRPSGSSPVIRVKAESGEKETAVAALEEAEEVIRENI